MTYKFVLRGTAVVAALGSVLAFVWPSGEETPVLKLPGIVEIQEVRLASKVGGRVKEVAVSESQVVSAGQVLVRLEAPEAEARLDQARAQLRGAEALLTKARVGARPEEKAAAREAARAAEARWRKVKACGMRGVTADLLAGQQLRHLLPSSRSTTQQPRTCGPPSRQWSRMSALSQPASSRASDRTARRAGSRWREGNRPSS
ncbi:MAG TPA: biotin/lipoyl-binding protein [Gemmataceae bacterium]|nr:biotin/lipoyl-binding protein [Gemmataceae bacterium]